MPLENGYGYEQDSLKKGEGKNFWSFQMLHRPEGSPAALRRQPRKDFQPLYDIAAFLAEQIVLGRRCKISGVVVAEWRKICSISATRETSTTPKV